MSRKREIARRLVAEGLEAGECGVGVSTRDSADRLLADSAALERAVAEGRAGIVDSVTRERGGSYRESKYVRYVASPGDITDIGIRTTGFFEEFDRRETPVRTSVVSISTMLMYVDLRRVFRFMNVITGRVQQHDWLGAAVLETEDRTAFDTFAPLFDGMVQTRVDDDSGNVELRVLGLEDASTAWIPL